MVEQSCLLHGRWEIKRERERKGLGSQYPLQGHTHSDLTSFHKALHPKGSITFQKHHRLGPHLGIGGHFRCKLQPYCSHVVLLLMLNSVYTTAHPSYLAGLGQLWLHAGTCPDSSLYSVRVSCLFFLLLPCSSTVTYMSLYYNYTHCGL
jgi:hypothetical protein